MTEVVKVIGAGLAGSEAAWQIANNGVAVELYEMRPNKQTPAHQTDHFAELVCSNSLRGNSLTNAVGVLKEEMRQLNSLIIKSADETAVPAGGALAVDRENFSRMVTEKIKKHPLITIKKEEVTNIPNDNTVIATGPLTTECLSEEIKCFNDSEGFYFYDAAAPIVDQSTINMEKVYLKSRYNKGEAAYLNCPMTQEEFQAFYEALIAAETVPLKTFEKEKYFEGCMPIEVMAKRGIKTMLFGPMKPVGLEDPKTGKRPFAVIQLRQDNAAASLYNMVGFQTHLKWGEQKRVFQMIPGLENAEFIRYGVMHRNSFINSPELLKPTYQSQKRDNLFFAGQMTGVEGYVESAASGLLAGINAARLTKNNVPLIFPRETVLGSMAYYITHTEKKHFQPMNANFGLLPELPERIKDKKIRYEALATRALDIEKDFLKTVTD
ncbi:FADH(2)-oxidizing methylenetetrahydrofolate--tRNA-(uracil(54)-C(5))-methyltransferase TrmFO [Melissococcus plutonius]|uniref:Methylenetetrahydrofolate--tRNA-(uracil-5-)-methyltransferase TrmFO n=1 Tax=Melissococcus plutonius (strain ATCC 35311 / DSM 29964 / CIP 104052 / LMG 20360 / NCIMB 702443) TaxID=940190 RepID=F3YAP4_MELPT|nr:FADH(2)-oxidizing methylenetetrahydrofolate--tRNA-(uracil(54)-C(5))-methyltransferase TrmFO [Melissococcus plutonius]AIM25038.1 methylenetetrahydrofolate--tRNA-(uracil-5-)-methyltransferase TrmFO [Melissococcus plutonius S1]KMT25264.1 methylenetetrahydrofolate--tRNA-(uracil-5-)- methyltransferase TrmFO [Melissococcus plutonius]KMT26170.1 methylenetetrahydrofolate--tRNA-(uracil-5-)- methyltransferase TrmFO [Melissococcus plutonius]KMT26900.1 methylenetetrahydrofolate--tRNA-(uracil-5-)- methyl